MITKTYTNSKTRNWMQFRDDIRAASFSLSQAMRLHSNYTEPDVIKELVDNTEYNMRGEGYSFVDNKHEYYTGSGLYVSWQWGDTNHLTVTINHPRGWYPESSLLASLWQEGYRWNGEQPFEYNEYESRCILADIAIKEALRDSRLTKTPIAVIGFSNQAVADWYRAMADAIQLDVDCKKAFEIEPDFEDEDLSDEELLGESTRKTIERLRSTAFDFADDES